jgi:hypothetical protein
MRERLRLGCAAGKHRAWTLGQLVTDWIRRKLCEATHFQAAYEEQSELSSGIEQMLQWQRWSRHVCPVARLTGTHQSSETDCCQA